MDRRCCAVGVRQDSQPYRVDLHDGETVHQEDQGAWITGGDDDNSIQVGPQSPIIS
jgi:hypothetical protein